MASAVRTAVRSGCGSVSGVAFASSVAGDGVDIASGLGFEGIETVAKPRAGLEAGFFFFLLLGGIMARSINRLSGGVFKAR